MPMMWYENDPLSPKALLLDDLGWKVDARLMPATAASAASGFMCSALRKLELLNTPVTLNGDGKGRSRIDVITVDIVDQEFPRRVSLLSFSYCIILS